MHTGYLVAMRRFDQPSRPVRIPRAVRRVPRSVQVVGNRNSCPEPRLPGANAPESVRTAPLFDAAGPYVDYGRFLTSEGGVLFIYKDIDRRLRHYLWRIFAWTTWTGGEAWILLKCSAVHSEWITRVCLLAMAIINWLIVAKPVEVYRRVEIRPDCMIIDGVDVFWTRHMESGWPTFQPDEDGNHVLAGIYGSRYLEYLTVHRFDDNDRMREVFVLHLQEAMKQLWDNGPQFR
jgi:hypothetical protein